MTLYGFIASGAGGAIYSYQGDVIVTDSANVVVYNQALSSTADLVINGVNDGNTQNVIFDGSIAIPLDSLTVNGTMENATVSVPISVDNGGISINVANDLLLNDTDSDLTNTAGGIVWNTQIAAGDVPLANGSGSFSKTNIGFSGADLATAAAIVNNPANFYFNLHSQANPGGVLRAQMNNTGQPQDPGEPKPGEPKPGDPNDPYYTPGRAR